LVANPLRHEGSREAHRREKRGPRKWTPTEPYSLSTENYAHADLTSGEKSFRGKKNRPDVHYTSVDANFLCSPRNFPTEKVRKDGERLPAQKMRTGPPIPQEVKCLLRLPALKGVRRHREKGGGLGDRRKGSGSGP